MVLLLHPTPDYPLPQRDRDPYHLGSLGLTVTTTVTNVTTCPSPFGVGFHPYLSVTTPTIEGRTRGAGPRLRRRQRAPVAHGRDTVPSPARARFIKRKSVSGHELDVTYTELIRDDSGLGTWFAGRRQRWRSQLSMDRNFSRTCRSSTGDILERGRGRTAVAVEPMTCPPDALRGGKDVIVLEPGQHWAGSWRYGASRRTCASYS